MIKRLDRYATSKLQIRVVANGFMVDPIDEMNGQLAEVIQLRVFETLESLFHWIQSNLDEEKRHWAIQAR